MCVTDTLGKPNIPFVTNVRKGTFQDLHFVYIAILLWFCARTPPIFLSFFNLLGVCSGTV